MNRFPHSTVINTEYRLFVSMCLLYVFLCILTKKDQGTVSRSFEKPRVTTCTQTVLLNNEPRRGRGRLEVSSASSGSSVQVPVSACEEQHDRWTQPVLVLRNAPWNRKWSLSRPVHSSSSRSPSAQQERTAERSAVRSSSSDPGTPGRSALHPERLSNRELPRHPRPHPAPEPSGACPPGSSRTGRPV